LGLAIICRNENTNAHPQTPQESATRDSRTSAAEISSLRRSNSVRILVLLRGNSVADLRPLGGINRTRKKVYAAISARRHELNEARQEEPSSSELAW